MTDLYSIPVKTAAGETATLEDYKGKLILVVNTASKCGFTKQYKGLEALYNQYKDRGLAILGFPCNQFGKQEPGSDEDIQEFCKLNFGVSFPVYAKLDVNGPSAHPLFVELKKRSPGLLGTEGIKWNFTKFLISKDGQQVNRYAPKDSPESLQTEIERML